jgi:hypothetical protein
MYQIETIPLNTVERKSSFRSNSDKVMLLSPEFLAKVDEAEKYECWGSNVKVEGKNVIDHLLIAKGGKTLIELRVSH